MQLKPGTRVKHELGRLATVERFVSRNNGYRVRFDETRQFEPELVLVASVHLTPIDPRLHERWEAAWPPFLDRSWASNQPERTEA